MSIRKDKMKYEKIDEMLFVMFGMLVAKICSRFTNDSFDQFSGGHVADMCRL